MQLPVVRVRSPSVVAKAASNSRTLKQKPLHHKAARAPDLPLMQITGGGEQIVQPQRIHLLCYHKHYAIYLPTA